MAKVFDYDGMWRFKVRWTDGSSSWEPLPNLDSCGEGIVEFFESCRRELYPDMDSFGFPKAFVMQRKIYHVLVLRAARQMQSTVRVLCADKTLSLTGVLRIGDDYGCVYIRDEETNKTVSFYLLGDCKVHVVLKPFETLLVSDVQLN